MSKPLKRSALELIEGAARGAAPETTAEATPMPSKPRTTAKPKAEVKQLTLYLDTTTYRQLREIAFTEETKMHPLILEALDMLFRSRSRPEIARRGSKAQDADRA